MPQGVVVAAVVGKQADPDRCRREDLVPVDIEGLLQPLEQPLDLQHRPRAVVMRAQQEDEFVAADPRQHVLPAEFAGDAACELDENVVADGVPVIVVDVLEVVDVDEGQSESRSTVQIRPRDELGHHVLEMTAVRQAGQIVVIGAAEQLGLAAPLARQVEGGREIVGVAADLDPAPQGLGVIGVVRVGRSRAEDDLTVGIAQFDADREGAQHLRDQGGCGRPAACLGRHGRIPQAARLRRQTATDGSLRPIAASTRLRSARNSSPSPPGGDRRLARTASGSSIAVRP